MNVRFILGVLHEQFKTLGKWEKNDDQENPILKNQGISLQKDSYFCFIEKQNDYCFYF